MSVLLAVRSWQAIRSASSVSLTISASCHPYANNFGHSTAIVDKETESILYDTYQHCIRYLHPYIHTVVLYYVRRKVLIDEYKYVLQYTYCIADRSRLAEVACLFCFGGVD